MPDELLLHHVIGTSTDQSSNCYAVGLVAIPELYGSVVTTGYHTWDDEDEGFEKFWLHSSHYMGE